MDWQQLLSNSSVQTVLNGAVNSIFPQKSSSVKATAPVQVLASAPAPGTSSSMDMKTIAMWGGLGLAAIVGLFLVLRK